MMARRETVDFGDLGLTHQQDRDVRAVLAAFDQEQRRLDFHKVRQAAQQVGVCRTFSDADGFGGSVKMRIPPWLYHKCGQFYGYDCWSDADFCKQIMKHYPECRVQTKSQTPSIIVPDCGPLGPSPAKRFTKVYAKKEQEPCAR